MKRNTMRRMIVLMFFCTMVSTVAFAQWRLGMKAGVGSTTTSITNWDDNSNKLGLLAGGVAVRELSPHFDLQGELFYANRGFKTNIYIDADNSHPHDWTFTYHYLNLPVLLKWYPAGRGIYLLAGPQAGCLLDSSNDIEGWPKDEPQAELDWRNEYHRWDVAVVGGIGAAFNGGFFLDIRYDLGLTKVNRIVGGKHRALELNVGYLF